MSRIDAGPVACGAQHDIGSLPSGLCDERWKVRVETDGSGKSSKGRNAAREVKVSFPTASAAVDRMIEVGILRESSGKRRGRLFLYESYLDTLNKES
jgi:hypothetical protein